MNSSSALRLLDVNVTVVGPNVGELMESVLAASAFRMGGEVVVLNSSTDNLPFLIEQAGARDEGKFLDVWSSNESFSRSGAYSDLSRYQVLPSGLGGLASHRKVLEKLNLLKNRYATLREMLVVFLSRRDDLSALFKRKRRLIAVGSDYANPTDAACLCLVSGKLVLRRISLNKYTRWRKTDLFVIRSKISPSPR